MINLIIKQALIRNFPCFESLSSRECADLAELMSEVIYKPHETIVTEGEPIDSVYIIIQGEAEVTKNVYNKRGKKKKKPELLAVLRSGEAIGLDEGGFYSKTGIRTATVISTSAMLLLRLTVNDLYKFLKQNNLNHAIYRASEQMLRMKFIKQSLPFARLSHDRLKWLSEKIEEKFYPKGTIIFNQGDPGDFSYLIRKGEIEITNKNEEGEIKQLAVLKSTVLFGEATLLTRSVRNATATATDDTVLYALRHEHLSELIESEQNVANMFMTLMVDRSLPKQNPNVISQKRTTADGQELMILRNLDNNNYFNLSKEGAFIWQQLTGQHSMQDITLSLADKHHVFAPDMVVALIAKLTRYGFIENLQSYIDMKVRPKPRWHKVLTSFVGIFRKRYAFSNADQWLTRIYQKYLRYLFTLVGQILLATIAFVGFATFIGYTDNVMTFFSDKNENLLLLLLLIPLSLVSLVLHELGHAFAVKACGREVNYIGFGWDFIRPIAFIDSSDMWLATRKQRMIVNISGVYVDLLIAGVCALAMVLFNDVYIHGILWVFALFTYIRAFKMLTPFQDMDGYYLLIDWLEKPQLRRSAALWLMKKHKGTGKAWQRYKPEIAYWSSGVIFLLGELIIVFLLQACALTIFGIQFSNAYASLIIPFAVVILSSLSIFKEIREKKEEN